jgi:hypothetical protein
MTEARTYRDIISLKGYLVISPKGTSMRPFLRDKRDAVKLVKPNVIKRLEVVLYQRANNSYLLHRVIKIKNGQFFMCGDNQWKLESGISFGNIIAVMDGYFRKDRYRSRSNLFYRAYSVIWSEFRFLRWIRDRSFRLWKAVFRNGKNDNE